MMNTNQAVCNLEAWQVQRNLEEHSNSFSWWDHAKNMLSAPAGKRRNYEMAYKGGDKEASKWEEKYRQMSWKAQPYQDKKNLT